MDTKTNLSHRPSRRQPRRTLPLLLLVGCALLIGIGCRSTGKPDAMAFAAVRISDRTPAQISYSAVQVFRENGYLVAHGGLTNLVFERKASSMNNITYGNWVGDTPVWERVKAEISPVNEATFRLQCEAFMVRDKGGTIEEEIRLGKLHRGHYQKLLEAVVQRVKQEQ